MLLLFLLHSMGIALFRLTGAICRDETIASTGGVRYCRALRCKHAVLGGRSVALVWAGAVQHLLHTDEMPGCRLSWLAAAW